MPYQIETSGATTASPRNGKLPRRVAAYNREVMDSGYRERMQHARARLAQEIGEVMPDSLTKLRLQRGMSQTQLAQRIGTSQSHVAKIESGKVNLYLQTAIKIADELQVSLDTLRPLVEISQIDTLSIQPQITAL